MRNISSHIAFVYSFLRFMSPSIIMPVSMPGGGRFIALNTLLLTASREGRMRSALLISDLICGSWSVVLFVRTAVLYLG